MTHRIFVERDAGFASVGGIYLKDRSHPYMEMTNLPMPTVTGHAVTVLTVDDPNLSAPVTTNKPPYNIPTMKEVRSIPWNGYTVASTFAGCGGSSTGYRMAGYRVLYCNERVDDALDSYRANAAPYTFVDGRDIRKVQPSEVLKACGLAVGDLDILDGSPPCDSFSTVGMREKGWGKVKNYSGSVQRTDDLTWEFIRLLTSIQPRVFVVENVSGLLRGKAKGYFIEMMRSMKEAGYTVACRLLDAQWLGVAQSRQRTIFVGVRNDIVQRYRVGPVHPRPLPYNYTVRDALPDIAKVETPITIKLTGSRPSRVMGSRYTHDPETGYDLRIRFKGGDWTGVRRFDLTELRALCGFPSDFILTGSYIDRWTRLGLAVPPMMMSHVGAGIRDEILTRLHE